MGFSIPLSHWFRDGLKTVFEERVLPNERSWPICSILPQFVSGGRSISAEQEIMLQSYGHC